MAVETEDNKRLREATTELSGLDNSLKVKVMGGKMYAPVKDRNRIFRKWFGTDASYISKVEYKDQIVYKQQVKKIIDGKEKIVTEEKYFPPSVTATTEIWIKKNMVSIGIAEEFRNSSLVNKTSATENAMTSSLGIALARLGLEGGEFASAEEMQIASHNGKAVDGLNNVRDDTSQKNDSLKESFSPNKIQDSSSVEISIKQAKHLGQLQAVFTKNKDTIVTSNELQSLYQKKEEQLNTNKPVEKDDDWL